MVDWPRRLRGHVVDRELTHGVGVFEYRYHCVRCGVRVEDPDDDELARRSCVPAARGANR